MIVVAAAVLALLRACDSCGGCAAEAMSARRVATFNIRELGKEPKDMERLAAIVRATRADVIALQEVMRADAAQDLARLLSREPRRFRVVLAKCGGKGGMYTGFLFDEARIALTTTREYPELAPDGSCDGGDKAGLLGTFEPRGPGASDEPRAFQLLSVHFVAGSEPERLARRKEQWTRATRIANEAKSRGPVAILGDTNSTGFLDDRGGEKSFILDVARDAALTVETRDLRCSEYFGPKDALRPSLLDHVVATPGMVKRRSIEVHGFCAELHCEPANSVPPDWESVSDHCPVSFDLESP